MCAWTLFASGPLRNTLHSNAGGGGVPRFNGHIRAKIEPESEGGDEGDMRWAGTRNVDSKWAHRDACQEAPSPHKWLCWRTARAAWTVSVPISSLRAAVGFHKPSLKGRTDGPVLFNPRDPSIAQQIYYNRIAPCPFGRMQPCLRLTGGPLHSPHF